MISLYRGWLRREAQSPTDVRVKMIAETEAFLNWALTQGDAVPRIPRRRASGGGFTGWRSRPGAMAASHTWWDRTLRHFAG